jgi:hypothetical protein
MTTPYIMPDGTRLSRYLAHAEDDKAETARRRRSKSSKVGGGGGGKEALWALLQQQVHRDRQQAHHHHHHPQDPELAALERVGRARARRMLNDRVLRDLAHADDLTPDDMRSLFSPAPFGGPVRPGPFAAVTGGRGGTGAGGGLESAWDAFRSIDMDKQERLLEGWAAAVAAGRREARLQRRAEAGRRREERQMQEQQEQQQQQEGADEGKDSGAAAAAAAAAAAVALATAAAATTHRRREARASAAAAAALAAWARVPRGARVALRRANVHAVLDLESDMLTRLEAADGLAAAAARPAPSASAASAASATVVIARGADGFGRLVAHGLAAFHGLSSASCDVAKEEAEEEGEEVGEPTTEEAAGGGDTGGRALLGGSGRGVAVWRAVASGGGVITRPASAGPSGSGGGGAGGPGAGEAEAGGAVGAAGTAAAAAATTAAAALAAGTAAAPPEDGEVVTCTDLLMAMQEGAYLTAASVARYARAHLILSGATTPARR